MKERMEKPIARELKTSVMFWGVVAGEVKKRLDESGVTEVAKVKARQALLRTLQKIRH